MQKTLDFLIKILNVDINSITVLDNINCIDKTINSEYVVLINDNIFNSTSSLINYKLSPKLTRMARTVAAFENPLFAQKGLIFEFEKNKIKNKQDAVITWASGKDFCHKSSVKVFVNSLKYCGFIGDKLVFTHDMDIESREYFTDEGFIVVDVNPSDVEVLLRDRHRAYYEYLCEHDYRYVTLVDSKDVIFQCDPTDFITNEDKQIYFVDEGKKHKDCDWNKNEQFQLQNCINSNKYRTNYENWPVVCGGTILGCSKSIKQLIIQLWSTALFTKNCTDQATLNFLYNNFYLDDEKYMLVDPNYHCLVATADLPSENKPIFKNNVLFNSILDKPYCIWHQWDRTEYKNQILEYYLGSFKN